MLGAEAMRLAAIEVLKPTASVASDQDWPTLARHRVYDSATIVPGDLEADAPYTPVLSLYTDDVRIERRGDSAPSSIGFPTAVLVVVAELTVAGPGENGEAQVFPFADDDPRAKLVLGALCAQVRKALNYSEPGSLFRSIVSSVERFDIEAFSLPQFDLRWMRSTMRFTCRIADDKFTDAAGLPEPLKGLYLKLPADSYARAKLAELNAAFTATTRTALDAIVFSTVGDPAGDAGPEGSVLP